MKYYIYRIKYKDYLKIRQTDIIDNKLDNLMIQDGSKVIIIVSQSMVVIGAYHYVLSSNRFVRDKEINTVITKFYEKLPMVEFVDESTYRMFSKRLREIDEQNFNAFCS
ncbi:MAG: hypothetical protein ACMXYG_07475 [Candidatus Woesearchaeota archaeon]